MLSDGCHSEQQQQHFGWSMAVVAFFFYREICLLFLFNEEELSNRLVNSLREIGVNNCEDEKWVNFNRYRLLRPVLLVCALRRGTQRHQSF